MSSTPGAAGQAVEFFFFQAEDGIRDDLVTGVQTCALPIFTARDVNGDSFLDVVITTLWTNKPVAILLNDGLGNFTYTTPSEFQSAFAAPETSCTSAADENRDATALVYSRSIPGDCGEESGSFSRRSMSELFSPRDRK